MKSFNAEARNRPLRGFATHREANTPSEMRLSRSDQVWVSEANCEAAARPRASAERRRVRRDFYGCLRQGSVRRSQGLGVRNWSSFRVFGVFRGSYQPRTPYSRQLRRATSRHKTLEFYPSSTVQAAQSSSISGTGGWLIAPPPHAKKIYPAFHSSDSTYPMPFREPVSCKNGLPWHCRHGAGRTQTFDLIHCYAYRSFAPGHYHPLPSNYNPFLKVVLTLAPSSLS